MIASLSAQFRMRRNFPTGPAPNQAKYTVKGLPVQLFTMRIALVAVLNLTPSLCKNPVVYLLCSGMTSDNDNAKTN